MNIEICNGLHFRWEYRIRRDGLYCPWGVWSPGRFQIQKVKTRPNWGKILVKFYLYVVIPLVTWHKSIEPYEVLSPLQNGRTWLQHLPNWTGSRGFSQNLVSTKHSTRVLLAHMKYPVVPRRVREIFEREFYAVFLVVQFESIQDWNNLNYYLKVVISKRLAQCMHPALPSGVHQKALETYDIIFKCMGTNRW